MYEISINGINGVNIQVDLRKAPDPFTVGNLPVIVWPYLLMVGIVFAVYITDRNTWLKIEDSKLISSGQFEFSAPRSVPIHLIKEVRRIQQSGLVSSGYSYFAFYGDDGLLMHVREANYSQDTIKQFMTDLKEKLPFATFDPQYEELISKPPEELSNFKRRSATHDSF